MARLAPVLALASLLPWTATGCAPTTASTAPPPASPAPRAASTSPAEPTTATSASAAATSASAAPIIVARPTSRPPCTEQERESAGQELDLIQAAIRGLPEDGSDASSVGKRLVKLASTPCFAHASHLHELEEEPLEKARAAALVEWWGRGGRWYFDTALSEPWKVLAAPDLRTFVGPETLDPKSPLALVVCPSSARACDGDAEGYLADLQRELERVSMLRADDLVHEGTPKTPADCEAKALEKPEAERLATFRDCVVGLTPERVLPPIGHLRAPRGWLVLRGRRGHYGFCDELRAYDLASGAAFVAQECSRLVLTDGGRVDQGATKRGGGLQVTVGRVSPDQARRLGLLLFLREPLDQRGRERFLEQELPASLPVPQPIDGGIGHGGGFGGGWGHSGQTSITFELLDGERVMHHGRFTWPDAYDPWDQIADDWVRSLEATLTEGCAPARPPKRVTAPVPLSGVSRLDASPEALRQSGDALAAALEQAARKPTCPR